MRNYKIQRSLMAFAVLVVFAWAVEVDAAGFCSQTADILFSACKAGVTDDALVNKAICLNIEDSAERDECQSDAQDTKQEDSQLCQDQHSWRLDACKLVGEDRYDPDFDPSHFDSDFTNLTKPNPYFPLTIGNSWKYQGGGEVNTIVVLDRTKLMEDGVRCIVFRDKVFTAEGLKESTDDWFAQATNGDVWYCGEEVKDYEFFEGDQPEKPELVSIDGSFKAGRDGDKPGIIFLVKPKKDDVIVEEFSLANAEDVTVILSANYSFGKNSDLDQMVPQQLADRFCSNNDCVVTKNFSLLEPGVIDRKYYARGIGVFLEVELTAGSISQLVECNFDSRCENLPQP